MRVTDSYPLLPNVCYYCRTATFPGVDLQRDDDDNPNRMERIYLCHKCLIHTARQIAPRVGLRIVTDTEVAAMDALIAALTEERDGAVAEAQRAVDARDALLASLTTRPAPAFTSQIIEQDGGYITDGLPATIIPASPLPPRKPGRPKKEITA